MNENVFEFDDLRIEGPLNKRGVDEQNLRHLKTIAVRRIVEVFDGSRSGVETVCAHSPDTAILMLRGKHLWLGYLLDSIAKANEAIRALALSVDADGSSEEQASEDLEIDQYRLEYAAAMDVLRHPSAKDCADRERQVAEALRFIRSCT